MQLTFLNFRRYWLRSISLLGISIKSKLLGKSTRCSMSVPCQSVGLSSSKDTLPSPSSLVVCNSLRLSPSYVTTCSPSSFTWSHHPSFQTQHCRPLPTGRAGRGKWSKETEWTGCFTWILVAVKVGGPRNSLKVNCLKKKKKELSGIIVYKRVSNFV